MKRTLVLFAAGTLLVCPAWAQDGNATPLSTSGGPLTTSTANPPPRHEHRGLTQDEMDELRQAHEAAFKANPDLEAEGQALREKMDAYEKKLHEAMIKADPKVAPILAKMPPRRPGGPGGPPPPPDGGN